MAVFFCTLVLTTLLIIFWKDLKKVLEEIRNQFGGPPGPTGPLPSTDTHLLLGRSRKKSVVL